MGLVLLQRGRLALHVLVDSGEGTFRDVSLRIRSRVAAGLSTMLRVHNIAQMSSRVAHRARGILTADAINTYMHLLQGPNGPLVKMS